MHPKRANCVVHFQAALVKYMPKGVSFEEPIGGYFLIVKLPEVRRLRAAVRMNGKRRVGQWALGQPAWAACLNQASRTNWDVTRRNALEYGGSDVSAPPRSPSVCLSCVWSCSNATGCLVLKFVLGQFLRRPGCLPGVPSRVFCLRACAHAAEKLQGGGTCRWRFFEASPSHDEPREL